MNLKITGIITNVKNLQVCSVNCRRFKINNALVMTTSYLLAKTGTVDVHNLADSLKHKKIFVIGMEISNHFSKNTSVILVHQITQNYDLFERY